MSRRSFIFFSQAKLNYVQSLFYIRFPCSEHTIKYIHTLLVHLPTLHIYMSGEVLDIDTCSTCLDLLQAYPKQIHVGSLLLNSIVSNWCYLSRYEVTLLWNSVDSKEKFSIFQPQNLTLSLNRSSNCLRSLFVLYEIFTQNSQLSTLSVPFPFYFLCLYQALRNEKKWKKIQNLPEWMFPAKEILTEISQNKIWKSILLQTIFFSYKNDSDILPHEHLFKNISIRIENFSQFLAKNGCNLKFFDFFAFYLEKNIICSNCIKEFNLNAPVKKNHSMTICFFSLIIPFLTFLNWNEMIQFFLPLHFPFYYLQEIKKFLSQSFLFKRRLRETLWKCILSNHERGLLELYQTCCDFHISPASLCIMNENFNSISYHLEALSRCSGACLSVFLKLYLSSDLERVHCITELFKFQEANFYTHLNLFSNLHKKPPESLRNILIFEF